MDLHWRDLSKNLPESGEMCLVYGYLSTGIGYGIRYWNDFYNCFEEYRIGGNVYQDDLDIKKWIPISELEGLLIY